MQIEELVEPRKYRIALIVDYLISEYSEILVNGVQEACRRGHVDLLIFQIGELNNDSPNYKYQAVSVVAHLKQKNIDGIIFVASMQTHRIALERYISYIKSFFPIPIVNIAEVIEDVPCIIANYEHAYKTLIRHVIKDIGAKKIGIMSVQSQSKTVTERERIIKEVFEEFNISFDDVTIWRSYFSYSSALYYLNEYKKHSNGKFDFDAIISLNDDMALACIDFAAQNNLKVPDDFVVIGFDDMRKATFNTPALSTINQRIFQQGYIAARTLFDVIFGKKVPMVQVVESKAVLRQSTNADKFINYIRNDNYIEIDRASLAGISEGFSALEWYQRRTQVYSVSNFCLELNSDFDEQTLMHHLTYSLQSIGFSSLSIVLFDHFIEMTEPFDYFTLPDKARLFYSFNNHSGKTIYSTEQDILFNPNDYLLPPEYFKINENPYIVTSLYNSTYQFGYLIIEKNKNENAIYEIVTKSISSILKSIFEKKKIESIYEKGNVDSLNSDLPCKDELSGLLNKKSLLNYGEKIIGLGKNLNKKGLVVYCNINNMKLINNDFGISYADNAIKGAATVLQNCFRSNDIIGRYKDDKFVVICAGLNDFTFERIREQINSECKKWVEDNNSLFVLSMSVGIAKFDNETESNSLEKLIQEASLNAKK